MTALKDKNMQMCCLAESSKFFFVVEASERPVGVLHRETDCFLIRFWRACIGSVSEVARLAHCASAAVLIGR